MRANAAGRAGAASTTTVGPSLFAIASRPVWLVECGVFNITTTAFAVALVRATASGTLTGGLVAKSEDPDLAPVGVASTGNSTAHTIGSGAYTQASIGAAIGAGVIWTFGKNGLKCPAGTANGFVLIAPTGTGQVFDFYFVWEE
jgi:hypothetical protein